MTTDKVTYTYQVEGTPAEVHSQIDALRRAGELARWQPRAQLPDGRLRVDATVYAHLTVQGRPRPGRVSRWLIAYGGSLPFLAGGGFVAGRMGAEMIAQVLAAVGTFLAAGFLLYAVITVAGREMHRRHCPGCPDH